MNKEKLEQLCRKEFSKIKGLYSSRDKFDIEVFCDNHVKFTYQVVYTSEKHSYTLFDDISKLKSYENVTKVYFGTSKECSPVGYITLININKNSRGNGFGRGIVEAVERIFKKTGQIAVSPVYIQNQNFWEHLGYKIDKNKKYGIKNLI